jgi:hypothetical protein
MKHSPLCRVFATAGRGYNAPVSHVVKYRNAAPLVQIPHEALAENAAALGVQQIVVEV